MKSVQMSKAFFFKFVERLLVKFLGLVIGIILARLLDPEIFGLLAIITVFINLSNTFMISGFSTALVQNRTANHRDYSTVYLITSCIGMLLIAVIWCIAPYIAILYDSPELITPLRVMAFSLIPGSLSAVQNAKLQRELRFKEMMLCNLVSTIVAGIAGISIALISPSIWALVVYQCGYTLIVAIVTVPVCGWYPKLEFSTTRAKEFFAFGSRILASSLLCSLYADIRSLIIGHRYSTTDLAHYSKAQQFPEIIANTVDSSTSSVLLSAMSSLQESLSAMHDLLLKSIRLAVFLVVPIMLGLAAVSETLIPILLTDKWASCIPLMGVFCWANIVLPVRTSNLCFIKARGRSDVYLKTEVIRRTVLIVVLLITVFCFDSVMAIAIGYTISSWLDTIIVIRAAEHCGGPKILEYFRLTRKTYVSGIVMFLIVLQMNQLQCASMVKLLAQIACGIGIYVGMSVAVRDTAFRDLYEKILIPIKRRSM